LYCWAGYDGDIGFFYEPDYLKWREAIALSNLFENGKTQRRRLGLNREDPDNLSTITGFIIWVCRPNFTAWRRSSLGCGKTRCPECLTFNATTNHVETFPNEVQELWDRIFNELSYLSGYRPVSFQLIEYKDAYELPFHTDALCYPTGGVLGVYIQVYPLSVDRTFLLSGHDLPILSVNMSVGSLYGLLGDENLSGSRSLFMHATFNPAPQSLVGLFRLYKV
jgi:hypothetical protein